MEVRKILVTNDMYGPIIADNAVMASNYYIMSRSGMRTTASKNRLSEFDNYNRNLFLPIKHSIGNDITDTGEPRNSPNLFHQAW